MRPPPAADRIASYQHDGYLLVKELFNTRELAPLRDALLVDHSIDGKCFNMLDVEGDSIDAIAWVEKSNTLLGLLPFARRTVDIAAALVGEEVYHWHSKLTIKRPLGRGRVEWHQDYGAWYHEGALEPALITVGIAIEPSTVDNGCLQVVRGSHKLGRVEHEYVENAQHRIDPRRLALASARFATVNVELDVGDAIFFHCNLLHGSAGNTTEQYRTLLLSSYNAASNSPSGDSQRARQYSPIETVDDVTFANASYDQAITGHAFLRPGQSQMGGFGENSFDESC
jgi:ectoine hydroxylase